MRIIGGTAGGRTLKAPLGTQTRPTSDRVREALFSILGAPGPELQVLDLFAGSGGLGLEAISRGATKAVFVDESNMALQTLNRNIKELGFQKQSEVHRSEAQRMLKRLCHQSISFDWIFIDPPYAGSLAGDCLTQLADSNLLRESALVVVEHDRRSPPDEAYGSLVRTDSRRYGDTCLSFYERSLE